MIKPSQTKQNEVKAQEAKRIEALNVLAFQAIRRIQRFIKPRIEGIDQLPLRTQNTRIAVIVNFIEETYDELYKAIADGVSMARIASNIEQKYLVEQTIGQVINWRKIGVNLPDTPDFRITREILSERSRLRRNKALAGRVAALIKAEVDKGSSIPKITQKVETELGLRDRNGKTTRSQLRDIKNGRFAHTNGQFYVAYRIARTESMRVASIQTHSTFTELQSRGRDVRLQLIAAIDSRTREQSVNMNRQISDEDGKFLYPNGRRYILGRAPARWSINDRETQIILFTDTDRRVRPIHDGLQQFKNQRAAELSSS